MPHRVLRTAAAASPRMAASHPSRTQRRVQVVSAQQAFGGGVVGRPVLIRSYGLWLLFVRVQARVGLASLTAGCACECVRGHTGDRLGSVLFSTCSPGGLLRSASPAPPFQACHGQWVLCSLLLGVGAFLLFSPLFSGAYKLSVTTECILVRPLGIPLFTPPPGIHSVSRGARQCSQSRG